MKHFLRTPLLSLIVLLLVLGTMICMDWRSTRIFLLIPAFLLDLLFFVVLLRIRLRERNRDGDVVSHSKAENVS
jgi:hypothetical protein